MYKIIIILTFVNNILLVIFTLLIILCKDICRSIQAINGVVMTYTSLYSPMYLQFCCAVNKY